MLLKVNRIFNWIPTGYKPEDVEDREDVPVEVKTRVADGEGDGGEKGKLVLYCEGKHPADREVLGRRPEGAADPKLETRVVKFYFF